jgi:copper transport protein
MVSRRPRIAAASGIVLFALALLLPGVAAAHATLEGTQPERGATVRTEPSQVVFRFDQPVEGNFGAVRVYDTRGQRVDEGDAFHPNGSGPKLGVHLKPGLAHGTYTATYRVVSADGHIVSGGFVFSIGAPGGAPGLTVAQLLGKSATGPVTEVAFGAARAIQYGAIAVAVGALVFLLAVWLPALRLVAGGSGPWRTGSEAFVARLRLSLLVCAIAGALSALAGVVLEAAEAAGVSGWAALKPHILSEVLGTKFGTLWTAGAAAWLLTGVLTVALVRPAGALAPVLRPVPLGSTGLALGRREALTPLLVGLPLLVLVVLPAWSGHGATQSPIAVMFTSITIHVIALSVWLGGLAMLLFAVSSATRRLDGYERTRLLAGVTSRFSPIALGCVIVLLASGLVQSYVEVRHFGLLTSTPFGRAVLIKFGLLLCLIALGAINRQRTVPHLRRIAQDESGGAPGAAGVILRRTLRAEVGLIVVVLGVTGALASYAPAIAQYNGPYSGTATLAGKQLQYTLEPARVGINELHLYLIDPKTGAQWDGAQQITVSQTLPSKGIGPISEPGQKSGPGHYTVPGISLGVPGTWKIQVQALINKFDQETVTLKVPVH